MGRDERGRSTERGGEPKRPRAHVLSSSFPAGALSSNNGRLHSVRGLKDLVDLAGLDTAHVLSRKDEAVLRM
jgi:hypothetical protein